MSPSNSGVTKGSMINGPRPFPLRINEDSHAIHKPSSSSLSNQTITHNPKHKNLSTKRQPVIIYTHSPKVIHAQARDFMALVQKLTGLSRDDEKEIKSQPQDLKDGEENGCDAKNVVYEDNESSTLMDEKFNIGEVKYDKLDNEYMGDIPLYTPNTNEFFCSPRNNSFFQSPMAYSNSPGLTDFFKFPEY